MFVVPVHAAFVEVDGGVPPTGTLTVVDEVEAAQTSSAVLAAQFSYSPLRLNRNHRFGNHNNIMKSIVFHKIKRSDPLFYDKM